MPPEIRYPLKVESEPTLVVAAHRFLQLFLGVHSGGCVLSECSARPYSKGLLSLISVNPLVWSARRFSPGPICFPFPEIALNVAVFRLNRRICECSPIVSFSCAGNMHSIADRSPRRITKIPLEVSGLALLVIHTESRGNTLRYITPSLHISAQKTLKAKRSPMHCVRFNP